LSKALHDFSKDHTVRISVGLDLGGTSFEALQELLASINDNGHVWVFHNRGTATFHPKIYLFHNTSDALLIVGSGNLTEGGLYTNYEASLCAALDLSQKMHRRSFDEVISVLDSWATDSDKLAFLLDDKLLAQLADAGDLLSEAKINKVRRVQTVVGKKESPGHTKSPFGSASVQGAPLPGTTFFPLPSVTAEEQILDDIDIDTVSQNIVSPKRRGFLMTLQKTDVGVGQTHSGTARRSPEVFIPLSARDHDPVFWEWPDSFVEDPARDGKFDRVGVKVRLGTSIIDVNMMTWPVKHDFRLRSEFLRSAGDIGDILRLEKSIDAKEPFDYFAEVIPQGRVDFGPYDAMCTEPVRNSKKRWGYY